MKLCARHVAKLNDTLARADKSARVREVAVHRLLAGEGQASHELSQASYGRDARAGREEMATHTPPPVDVDAPVCGTCGSARLPLSSADYFHTGVLTSRPEKAEAHGLFEATMQGSRMAREVSGKGPKDGRPATVPGRPVLHSTGALIRQVAAGRAYDPSQGESEAALVARARMLMNESVGPWAGEH